jgi:hypothetical protein
LSAQKFLPWYGNPQAHICPLISHYLTQETIIRFVRIKDAVFSTKGRAVLKKSFWIEPTQLHYQTAADLISVILGKFPL